MKDLLLIKIRKRHFILELTINKAENDAFILQKNNFILIIICYKF